MEVATLADLFPSRIVLGLGHGVPSWMREAGAWPARPLELLEQHVVTIRFLLEGENSAKANRNAARTGHFGLHPPPQVPPPIFVGVRSQLSLALSGRLADGTILAEPATPEYIHKSREYIARPQDSHPIVAYAIASIDDDIAVARHHARRALQWTGEPDFTPNIAPLEFSKELMDLRRTSTSTTDFAARLPNEWIDRLAIVGSAAAGRNCLNQLLDAGAGSVVLIPSSQEPMSALDSLSGLLD